MQLRINQGVNQLLPGVNQLLPRNGHGYQLVTDDPAYNGYHYRYALSAWEDLVRGGDFPSNIQ